MSSVYSSNLFELATFSGSSSLVVAADQVLVLRDVDVFSGVLIGTEFEFFLRGGASQVIWYLVSNGEAATVAQWRGRQVIGPGQELTVDVTSGFGDVTASGYLLSLP